MNNIWLSATAGAMVWAYLGSMPALAADVEPIPETYTYDWSGFYLGGHVGYGWGDVTVDSESAGLSGTFDMDGIVGGGQIGYLFAFDTFVIGPEASFTWTDLEDEQTIPVSDTQKLSIDWLAIFGGRIGFAADRVLLYARGGYAIGDVGVEVSLTTLGNPPTTFSRSDTKTHDGYAIGGGVEYGLTENVILGAEYMFVDLGKENYDGPIGPALAFIDADAEIHMITARMSFKFGGF